LALDFLNKYQPLRPKLALAKRGTNKLTPVAGVSFVVSWLALEFAGVGVVEEDTAEVGEGVVVDSLCLPPSGKVVCSPLRDHRKIPPRRKAIITATRIEIFILRRL